MNSVNKLMTEHAVDIIKLEAKLKKMEEKHDREINQLKRWYLSKEQFQKIIINNNGIIQ